MSKYINELMSPQLMGVIYAFVGFIIALYVLSVVYVFIDARAAAPAPTWHGASSPSSRLWASLPTWSCARIPTRPTARSRSWTWPCASASLPSTAPARSAAPHREGFRRLPGVRYQVRNVCPSCHRPLDAHWKVCPYCRTRIQ